MTILIQSAPERGGAEMNGLAQVDRLLCASSMRKGVNEKRCK
jgi:hypothetical protein